MELDNLKKLWNKDNKNTPPEISLEKQDEIHSPLEMIRINMKTEFWIMIVTLPGILYGFPFTTNDSNIKTISVFEVILSFGFIIYFYSRFIKLYKLLTKNSINTNYDLFNLKTQLLVSKEIYLAYYISYIPLALMMSLIKISFHFDTEYHVAIFGISLLISILLIFFIIKYWIYYMYGKYIQDVIHIVDELNGVELKPRNNKTNTWFERSQRYLIKKYGIKGNIINTIVWFFSCYVAIILFLLIILLIIIIIGAKLNFIDLNILLKTLNRLN
ncbi:hypothetical protein [Chryseobacterium mulctrae]|uniref:hypothetical protein n=1 Tax=Chryseobacterium mulctrae TaxID=2576777 RepID=UPI001116E9A6|nr:hypothetical protein [Chryseobacterium mulctrae]